ncbi:uncharacterized protein LOC135391606 [Ornithodoros turicata]|uniref:uncharacterized protein LOC135391606 n=1 Tax=Ornithodoros turicata TaxID=34597 RepID=UPI00313A1B50
MNIESFMQAFRRFISRRSVPSKIYFDNFSTFKRASRFLRDISSIINGEPFERYCDNHNITWHLIAERAAWWGGFWERLVRTVKDSLPKALGRSSLTLESLITILIEVEAIVNSRPLTYMSDDSRHFSALSPSHFLVGKRLTALPQVDHDQDDPEETHSTLLERNCKREEMLAQLWTRWSREYISELHSGNRPQYRAVVPFRTGELVLVPSRFQSRLLWALGRFIETYPGGVGVIRVCKIQLPDEAVIRRPVQLLNKLEL